MITKMANIAANVVFPVEFNKNRDAPKIDKAKNVLGSFCKRYLDLGAAKNPHITEAASGNAIRRKYLITTFCG